MATYSMILALKIPWIEEPGRLHEEKNVPQASYTNNLSVFCAAYDKTADGNASRYIFKTDGAEREFTLNKTSGIAAGSYKTEDGGKIFPAKWKAVALPGAETGTVSGAYWYSVPFEYKDSAAGAVRKRSVRKGGAVLSE